MELLLIEEQESKGIVCSFERYMYVRNLHWTFCDDHIHVLVLVHVHIHVKGEEDTSVSMLVLTVWCVPLSGTCRYKTFTGSCILS